MPRVSPSTPPSPALFQVVDGTPGNWRVLNRTDLTDYRVFKYPGFTAAIGIDPTLGVHDVVYLEYPKAAWDKDELARSPDVKKKIKDCLICQTMNKLADTNGQSPLQGVVPEQAVGSSGEMNQEDYLAQAAPRAAQVRPVQMSAGDVVPPKYITAFANIGTKVFCTRLGCLTAKMLFSVLTDLMAGWSSDPGQRAAFKQMSDQFVEDLDIGNDGDTRQLKADLSRLYESYGKSGDAMGSLKRGMFKSPEDILKDNGLEVTADKTIQQNTTYALAVRSLRRPSLTD